MLQEYVEKLVQMSASNSDIDILRGEITILQADRVKLVRKLNRLQAEANPERYFDPAAQLADQQEKLRLGQKIAAKEEERNEMETQLSICKDEEAEAHRKLAELQAHQDELHKNQQIIEQRLEAAKLANNEKSVENYTAALQTCMEESSEKDAEVSIAAANYQVVASKLETISTKLREIETTLGGYQKNRDEIDAKLGNPNSYMNEAFQQKEMKAIAEAEQDIAKIDARLTEIENDPMMLADEIKAMIAAGNEKEALSLVEKLANVVEAMPYASLIGTPELEKAIKDATARKEAIEAKIAESDYANLTSADLVDARIDYLGHRIAFFEEQQKNISALVAQLDNDELFHTRDFVAKSKIKKDALKDTVAEYEAVVTNAVSESTLKRANLGRALSSKTKDLNTAENIYNSFVNDQREDISIAATLESSLLTILSQKIKACKEQLASIRGLSSKKKSEKDIIAEARDRRVLVEVNEEIAKMERWSQYEISPKQMVTELTGKYQFQQEESVPVLEPIIPDALSLQDSVKLGTTTLPDITLEEIPFEPVSTVEQFTGSFSQAQPEVPAAEGIIPGQAPVIDSIEFAPEFEVSVVPMEAPDTTFAKDQTPAIDNAPALDVPVNPFQGFGEDGPAENKERLFENQGLPTFEEPKSETPARQTHKVIRIEDLANIHSTSAPVQEPVDTTLDTDTEYLGFTDYDAGLKVA